MACSVYRSSCEAKRICKCQKDGCPDCEGEIRQSPLRMGVQKSESDGCPFCAHWFKVCMGCGRWEGCLTELGGRELVVVILGQACEKGQSAKKGWVSTLAGVVWKLAKSAKDGCPEEGGL